jgi:hypothetical protein
VGHCVMATFSPIITISAVMIGEKVIAQLLPF